MRKLLLGALVLSFQIWAHNQNPAIVKRTVSKAFEVLNAKMPSQLTRGEKSFKLGTSVVQLFGAKDESGTAVGKVFALEFQEKYYSLALNTKGEVLQLVEDGSRLEESRWKDFSFVNEIKIMESKKRKNS